MTNTEHSVPGESFYDADYFAKQNIICAFGGIAQQFTFVEYVRPEMTAVDFGCGGGWLLAKLRCTRCVGIDVNPAARTHAAHTFGIDVHRDLAELDAESAELVISNHPLEHTLRPHEHVQQVLRILKPRWSCRVPKRPPRLCGHRRMGDFGSPLSSREIPPVHPGVKRRRMIMRCPNDRRLKAAERSPRRRPNTDQSKLMSSLRRF